MCACSSDFWPQDGAQDPYQRGNSSAAADFDFCHIKLQEQVNTICNELHIMSKHLMTAFSEKGNKTVSLRRQWPKMTYFIFFLISGLRMYANKLQVNLDLSVNERTALLSVGCECTCVRKC